MTFEEARALFPVLGRYAYLNAGSFGPLPQVAADLLCEQAAVDAGRGRGGRPYLDEMLAARGRTRQLVARLLGAQPEQIALTSSTTDGCNIVLAGLGLARDDEIVTADQEHFGLAGPVFASGARVRVARVGSLAGDELVAAITAEVGKRTKLIAVSHVLWTNGNVVDVHALEQATRVPILVDGAQSVGAIPVDVGALDYYTVSGQKWLCGPESTGALYVADVAALRVARPGYFAQESFEPGGRYVVRAGAQRFDPGWIPVGSLCRDALIGAEVTVVTEPDQAGLVTFVPRVDPEECAARAYEQGVIIRDLPGTGWARASCGWWTSDEDIDRLVEVAR